VARAYNLIGYTKHYANTITVEPDEAPDDHILDLHKQATQKATNAAERAEIARALVVIGRSRNKEELIKLGRSGQTFLSVDDAYAALSAPKDSIDEGLIM
jgi:ubiquitin carboxyl-terminal hydrolase 25/28